MTFNDALISIGVNVEDTLRRFSGNEALMKRFVCKFPQDKTFGQLKEAIANKDTKAIEISAHTLKGTSGNLGFTKLYELSSALCNAVRANDFAKADELSPQVIAEGEKVIETIGLIEG